MREILGERGYFARSFRHVAGKPLEYGLLKARRLELQAGECGQHARAPHET
jgi:hypothetical protein